MIKKLGSVAALSLVLHLAGGLKAAATVTSPLRTTPPTVEESTGEWAIPAAPLEIAQAGANCRVPNRLQDIYSEPSVEAYSQTLITVAENTPVYLVVNADGSFVLQNGFARATVRGVTGWVITRYLTKIPGCGLDEGGPSRASCARAITYLTVRRNPYVQAGNVIGELSTNQEVVIQADTLEPGTGRTWIQFPYQGTSGWAAETGSFGNGRNFTPRYQCNR